MFLGNMFNTTKEMSYFWPLFGRVYGRKKKKSSIKDYKKDIEEIKQYIAQKREVFYKNNNIERRW